MIDFILSYDFFFPKLSRLEKNAEKESTLEEFSVLETKAEKDVTDTKDEETDVKVEQTDEKMSEREEKAKEVGAISDEASLDAALNSLCLEPADSDDAEETEPEETGDSKTPSENSPLPSGEAKSVNFEESLKTNEDDDLPCVPVINSAEVLDANELLEFLKSLHTGPKVRENTTTVGMVSLSKLIVKMS